MNSQWRAFLESRSAQVSAGGQVRFAGCPSEAECALMDLSHLGHIVVSGPEAQGFLQGQLTNDVPALPANLTQIGGYCSPKGRMLASFRLFKLEDRLYLQMPLSQVEPIVRRLRVYLLRAQAAIEDASGSLSAIGLSGACAPSLLESRIGVIPEQDNELIHRGGLIVIRIPGPVPRFEILGPPESLEGLWDGLAAEASVLNADYWALLDIRAGIPTVYPQTSDAFVPQMVNLQLLDGVSFRKGCYTGQEVVARLQYLGRLKRRMYRARLSSDQAPEPGVQLHSAISSSEQAAGRLVDARRNMDGELELLAVVEVEAAEQGEVRLGGADGPKLSLSEPPYGFETAE